MHRLWCTTDLDVRTALQEAFAAMPALYIADGHHRMASSARLAAEKEAQDVDPKAWCLAYIVPQDHLHIYNFDRAMVGVPEMGMDELLEKLAALGTLAPLRSPRTAPGMIAIRTMQGWHSLKLPPPPEDALPAARLDAARLSELVLGPLLGIHDLRSDIRIRFIPGTQGTMLLDAMVSSGEASVAFHLHPIGFKELKAVADSGGSMPPKTTYIEPKLRSGLLVYSLEDV
jgi:uncharacterized protein (DUF1015 family)